MIKKEKKRSSETISEALPSMGAIWKRVLCRIRRSPGREKKKGKRIYGAGEERSVIAWHLKN